MVPEAPGLDLGAASRPRRGVRGLRSRALGRWAGLGQAPPPMGTRPRPRLLRGVCTPSCVLLRKRP